MERNLICRTLISAIVIFLLILSLTGCRTTGRIHIGNTLPGPGPALNDGTPPWVPAHGYNAKYHYRYYPYHGVYFDEGRNVYFYRNGGTWIMTDSLPGSIHITVNEYVMLDMDNNRPYMYHNEVVKRYPPGQYQRNTRDSDIKRSQDSYKGSTRDIEKVKPQETDHKDARDSVEVKTRETAKTKSQDNKQSKDQGTDTNKIMNKGQTASRDTASVKTEAKATRSGYTNKKSSRDKEDDEDDDKENDARRAVTRDSLISR